MDRQRDGFGPAMAKFIAISSLRGPIPADLSQLPVPSPPTSGCRPGTTVPATT
ncbi:hypothetical protein [Actinopolymorpha pittospori]